MPQPLANENLRIAFNQQIFLSQRYGGVSRYFASLARALNSEQEIDAKIFAPLHRNVYADQLPDAVEQWSLPTLREKLIKIGAKIVSHGRYVTFQIAAGNPNSYSDARNCASYGECRNNNENT